MRNAERFESEWPRAATRVIGAEAFRQSASATGGDGRLSKWPEIGSATVTYEGGTGHASVTGQGKLWKVLENGTTAHDVVAHGRALRTPYGPRKRVHVSGRKALNSWTRAMATARREVTTVTQAALDRLWS